jgi:hypothetical protein
MVDVSDLPGCWYHRELKAATAERPENSEGWTYIPHFFDLNRVHGLLRKWGVGEQCRLSVKRDTFDGPEHAINYITKYLVKMPRRGFPEWMLQRARLRFTGASGDVGRLVAAEDEPQTDGEGDSDTGSKEEQAKEKQENNEERAERERARPPVDRIAECGEQLVLRQYDQETDSFAVLGRVNAPRKAVELCPWAVQVEDFDFGTLQAFHVWGFPSAAAAWKFADTWQDEQLQAGWRARREERKERLLQTWAQSSNEAEAPADNLGVGAGAD